MTVLITSGEYISQELWNEIGRIPPVFMPVANLYLLDHQVESIRSASLTQAIYLTLPIDYELSVQKVRLLERYNIQALFVENSLSLGKSIFDGLSQIQGSNDELIIYYGDSLFRDFPVFSGRCQHVVTATACDQYNWHYQSNLSDEGVIWAGLFQFNEKSIVLNELVSAQFDFISALEGLIARSEMDEVSTKDWFDFGHVSTFYINRSAVTSERAFNSLSIDRGVITKESSDIDKIENESRWIELVPDELKVYVPQLVSKYNEKSNSYSLEYLPRLTLAELLVFGNTTLFSWIPIFDSISGYLETSTRVITEKRPLEILEVYRWLMLDNVNSRVRQAEKCLPELDFSRVKVNDIPECSVISIIQNIQEKLKYEKLAGGYFHGDMCLSNLLYDNRTRGIKVIDPRANAVGKFCNIGPLIYDFGKLAHSFVGHYDFIIAGFFDIGFDCNHVTFKKYVNETARSVGGLFLEKIVEEEELDQIHMIMITLFISMVPLHKENPDRCLAFVANAILLCKEYCPELLE